jgi:hypothetical protein
MKITVWLVTRERDTWITAAEIMALALVLLAGGPRVRVLGGLPLLVHLGYRALASLPLGSVPGRPGRGRKRRNYDLRARVVGFLGEVRRVEHYVRQAELAGWSKAEVEENLRSAQARMMAAAAEVAKAAGRSPVPADTELEDEGAWPRSPGRLRDVLRFRPVVRSDIAPRVN